MEVPELLLKTPSDWIQAQEKDEKTCALRVLANGGSVVSRAGNTTPAGRWAQQSFEKGKSNKSGFSIRSDGVLIRHSETGVQVVVPQQHQLVLLREFHSSSLGGHQGADRTFGKLERHFWFPNMKRTVEAFCAACPACAMVNNQARGSVSRQGTILSKRCTGPGQEWHLDFIGPFPVSQLGYRYVLVMVDAFSGWVETFPVPTTSAKWILSAFNQLIGMWGLPRRVRYDNGPGFNSGALPVEFERLGVHVDLIPPNHPESNGKVERMNKVVKSTVRRLLAACSRAGTDWFDVLFHSKFAINSSPSKSNGGFTAWQIQVGWVPQLPSECDAESNSFSEQSEEDWILSQAANRLEAN
jgi:hypothetical protein